MNRRTPDWAPRVSELRQPTGKGRIESSDAYCPPPLTEVSEVSVGAMNPDMALRAVMQSRIGRVVRRRLLDCTAVSRTPQVAGAIMAFQAQRKSHRPRQHPGIGGAVRNVA